MANMNINITGLDTIAQAINNLAQALGKGGVTASFSESTPAGPQSTQMAGNYQNPGPAASGPQQSGIPGAATGQPGVMQYQQPFTGQAGQGALPTTILYPGPDSHCTDWTHRPGQAGLCDADTGTVWRNVPHASAG